MAIERSRITVSDNSVQAINSALEKVNSYLDRLAGKTGENSNTDTLRMEGAAPAQVRFRSRSSINLSGNDDQKLSIAQGAHLDPTSQGVAQWIADGGAASILELDSSKGASFYRSSGLTAGTPFGPTGGASLGGLLHVNTTSDPVSDGTAQNMHTYDVPAGLLGQNGDTLHCVFLGTTANNTTAKTVAFYFGASSSLVISTATAALDWFAEMWVVRISATSQVIHVRGSVNAGPLYQQYILGAETLANSITIRSYAGGGAANDIVQKLTLVQFFPAPPA